MLRVHAKKESIARPQHFADALAINYRCAETTPKHRAMLEFALKVSSSSSEVSQADFDVLYAAGWSKAAAWDIGAITAFFAMSNRLASFSALEPNDEFHTIGRPKA